MVIIDIWGGELNMDHVARFVRTVAEALKISAVELERGYLVNLRKDIAFGSFTEFDARQ